MRNVIKSLIAIFSTVLLFSVGLNVYDRFILLPSFQTSQNIKDVCAFKSWLRLIYLTHYFLENPETNFDLNNAWLTVDTISRGGLTDVFTPSLESAGGLAQNLSYSVRDGTAWLWSALDAMIVGNKTGVVTERALDQQELNMVANLTIASGHVVNDTRAVILDENGVSLAQQLEENNLLTPLATHSAEVMAICQHIYNYYRG